VKNYLYGCKIWQESGHVCGWVTRGRETWFKIVDLIGFNISVLYCNHFPLLLPNIQPGSIAEVLYVPFRRTSFARRSTYLFCQRLCSHLTALWRCINFVLLLLLLLLLSKFLALPCPPSQASHLTSQANYGQNFYGSCRAKTSMLCNWGKREP